jgi:hypothetical protein
MLPLARLEDEQKSSAIFVYLFVSATLKSHGDSIEWIHYTIYLLIALLNGLVISRPLTMSASTYAKTAFMPFSARTAQAKQPL